MPTEFTDDDLQVHLGFGKDWVQSLADHARREKPHGQVKLLWSNLLGLALVEAHMQREPHRRSIELVVAGASPGTHMLVLLQHIRKWRQRRGVRIHLYDPLPLDADLKDMVDADESMSFERRPFTDQDAHEWGSVGRSATCVVFFSDIRSKIHAKKDHMRADEVKIAADMEAQKTWVQIMRPDYCMLKFHAPHATKDKQHVQEHFPYLYGRLYEQAWVGLFSAEYRLFCTKADMRRDEQYDTKEIERHAFYHTYFTRPSTFSVQHRQMPYDEAFAAHVAQKAAEAEVIDNAERLLEDAGKTFGHVAHMHFPWHAAPRSRLQALHLRMLQIL